MLGVLLGFGVQLIFARREEARRLDDARRRIYARFLRAVRHSLDHLAEGGLNRLNGAVEGGAYGDVYLADRRALEAAVSGMELVSTPPVLSEARAFRDAHRAFADEEARAEAVDRDRLDEAAFARLVEELRARLDRLWKRSEAFLAAAQRELRVGPLLEGDD